jgi:hypothetical protein
VVQRRTTKTTGEVPSQPSQSPIHTLHLKPPPPPEPVDPYVPLPDVIEQNELFDFALKAAPNVLFSRYKQYGQVGSLLGLLFLF